MEYAAGMHTVAQWHHYSTGKRDSGELHSPSATQWSLYEPFRS